MKETQFIEKHSNGWEDAQKALNVESEGYIEDVYQEVQDDLGYAQSHYSKRMVTNFLEGLAGSLHIFLIKQAKIRGVKEFYTQVVPKHLFFLRKYLLYSLVIVLLGLGTGYLGYLIDNDFARAVLSDDYVDMTLNNIQKGDPLGVYKSENSWNMFVQIATNNLRVAIMFFVLGSLFALGSGLIIYYNGLILGVFSALLIENGQGYEYFLTVYQHGTLEILTMVVEGATGLCIGASIFNPGKFSKMVALRRNAQTAGIVLLGTIPIIILAAFIESFLTRFTDLPNILRFGIIAMSLLFVIAYFIYIPWRRYRNYEPKKSQDFESKDTEDLPFYLNKNMIGLSIKNTISGVFNKIKVIGLWSVFFLILYWFLSYSNNLSDFGQTHLNYKFGVIKDLGILGVFSEYYTQPIKVLNWLIIGKISGFFMLLMWFFLVWTFNKINQFENQNIGLIFSLLLSTALMGTIFIVNEYGVLLLVFILPFFTGILRKHPPSLILNSYFSLLAIGFIITFIYLMLSLVLKSGVTTIIGLHESIEFVSIDYVIILKRFNMLIAISLLPFYLFFMIHAPIYFLPLKQEKESGHKLNAQIKMMKAVQSAYGLEVEGD